MSIVYLIPSVLHEEGYSSISANTLEAIKDCSVVFAENERTTRRFFKALDKSIVIDNYEWYTIHKAEEEQLQAFRKKILEKKNIAIVSEAGCPGIADPGQVLIAAAQQLDCTIKPLTGPSSILLALMASGLNGQQFEFVGYLPVDASAREKSLQQLEQASLKNRSTKIFIETPYRNNQLVESVLKVCNPNTKFCIAVNLTGPDESVKTRSVGDWKKSKPDIHKKAAIFLIHSSS